MSSTPGTSASVKSNSHIRWYLTFWLFLLSAVAFLDRVNISIASIFLAKRLFVFRYATRLDLQRISRRVRIVPDSRRLARRSSRQPPRAHRRSSLVGHIYGACSCNSLKDQSRTSRVHRHPLSAGCGGGRHLSGLESIRLPVDSHAGARHRQRFDFRGRGGWRGNFAATHHVRDAPLGLAIFLLGLRAHRDRHRRRLVCNFARHARGTSPGFSGASSAKIRAGLTFNAQSSPNNSKQHRSPLVDHNPRKQRSSGTHIQLFLLRIRRVDFLQLVLQISRQRSRPQFEIERLLRGVAISGDGDRVPARRLDQRPPHRSGAANVSAAAVSRFSR